VLDVRRLEDQLLELQTECSTAVQNLSQSNSHIKALQTEILTVENQVSELQEAKNDLEASLTHTVEERDRTIHERDASITALESERETYLTQLADLQNALNQAEASITSHVAQASIAKNEAASLRSAVGAAKASHTALVNTQETKDAELEASRTNISQLQQKIGELQEHQDRAMETVARLSADNFSTSEMLRSAQVDNEHLSKRLSLSTNETATLEAALATAKDDLLQCNATIERLSDSLIHSQDEAAALRNEVGALKLSVFTLEKDLDISTETAEELAAQLAASKKDRINLAMDLEKGKNGIAKMTLFLEETENRLSAANSAAEQFQADAKGKEIVVQDLRLQLAAAQSETALATDQLSAAQADHVQESTKQMSVISGLEQRLESTRTELQSRLREQGAQLVEAKLNLEAEQRRSSDLQGNLTAAYDKVQEVEEELICIRESKEADERTIDSLKEMFSALRETQIRSLTDLDNKVLLVCNCLRYNPKLQILLIGCVRTCFACAQKTIDQER
jgi:chromosome segregation ATPase